MSVYKITFERVEENNDAAESAAAKDEKMQSENLKRIASVVGGVWFRTTTAESQTEESLSDDLFNSILIDFNETPIDEKSIDEQIKELIALNEADKPQEVQSEMAAQMSRVVVQELDKRMAEDAAQHQV